MFYIWLQDIPMSPKSRQLHDDPLHRYTPANPASISTVPPVESTRADILQFYHCTDTRYLHKHLYLHTVCPCQLHHSHMKKTNHIWATLHQTWPWFIHTYTCILYLSIDRPLLTKMYVNHHIKWSAESQSSLTLKAYACEDGVDYLSIDRRTKLFLLIEDRVEVAVEKINKRVGIRDSDGIMW